MRPKEYDLIIIGGGAAGLVASKLAKGLGKKVAIVEKEERLGGECTWTGCVPSKTLIRIAHLIAASKDTRNFYQNASIECTLDSSKIMAAIHNKRKEIYKTHTPETLKKIGIDIFFGPAQFLDQSTIQLSNEILKAKKIVIATGSRPMVPPIEGLASINYLTNETIFELNKLPKSMVILGAGPIGIELAGALHKLGVTITIVERSEHILPKEDTELTHLLMQKLIQDGIDIKTSHTLSKVSKKNETIELICNTSNDRQVIVHAESLLVAVGRKPNVEYLNLDTIGVKTNPTGIIVNKKMQTTVPSIYACGDVVGPYQFSHMAEYQATIAVQNAFVPLFKKHVDYSNVIWVTFSDPELASAGLTESQARSTYGDSIITYTLKYNEIDRTKIDNNEFGICKVICDSKGYIIGAHILGERAGELIHEIQLGKYYNFRLWDFYKPIHAYPTYSEIIWHLSKRAYVAKLKNNLFIRFIKWITGI